MKNYVIVHILDQIQVLWVYPTLNGVSIKITMAVPLNRQTLSKKGPKKMSFYLNFIWTNRFISSDGFNTRIQLLNHLKHNFKGCIFFRKKTPHPKVIFNNRERRGGGRRVFDMKRQLFSLFWILFTKKSFIFPNSTWVIVNVDKFIVYVYYSSEMCIAFGVLKDVNISNI